jgi:hypothetical protein
VNNDHDPLDALAVAAMADAVNAAIVLVEQGGVHPADAVDHVCDRYDLKPEPVLDHLDGYRCARLWAAEAGCDCDARYSVDVVRHAVNVTHAPTCASLSHAPVD